MKAFGAGAWALRIVPSLLLIPAGVIGLASYPLLTFAILAGCGWHSLRQIDAGAPDQSDRQVDRRKLFLLAAIFGTIGEAICVCGSWWTPDGRGLWIYSFPSPWGLEGLSWKLPIWLPLVWGNLFLLFSDIAGLVCSRSMNSGRWRELVRYFLTLIILMYAGALFRTIDVRILYVFTPFFAAFLLYWNEPDDLAVFVVAAILGSFGEIWAMREGLWIYTKPLFLNEFLLGLGIPGVPISLPMAWGLSAVFLRRWSLRRSLFPEQI